MAGEPRFALSAIRLATAEDRFLLGGKRCRDLLLGYLDDLQTCRRFVQEVAAALTDGDFCTSKTLEITGRSEDFDEYGVELDAEVLDRYGLHDVTWYVKVTFHEDEWGGEALYVSVHPLEKPMKRAAGSLSPRKRMHS